MTLHTVLPLTAASSATSVVAATNPFNGVGPDLNWLGGGFNSVWVGALGGFLGLCLIVLAFVFVKALVGLRHARNTKKPQEAEHAIGVLIGTGLGIAGVILAPVLFVAITNAASQGA